MSQESMFAQFRLLTDLVRFVAFSPAPFLFHVERDGKHIYFVQILGLRGASAVFYVEMDKRVEGKYVVFNRFRDEITFSNRFEGSGQTTYIPILELERTNLFPVYPPSDPEV